MKTNFWTAVPAAALRPATTATSVQPAFIEFPAIESARSYNADANGKLQAFTTYF
jgi:hypothetical protein